MKLHADKKFALNVLFVAALVVFTVIVMRLSVNKFIIVMPIFAGLVFLSIFFVKDDDEEKDR